MKRYLFGLLAIGAFASPASAASLVLSPSAVIGSSGSYDSRFVAGNIFDQQTGVINETFANGYWINSDLGPTNAFITIDLGAAYSLSSFELFNTHNGFYGDRGTGAFSIVGGNSVTDLGSGNFAITGPTSVLANGVLTAASTSSPLAGQTFTSLDTGTFRYLEFLPTSVASVNAPCCSQTASVYGLNELRVSAVPEPATWALMLLGFGMIGFAMRKRSNVRTTVSYA